MKKVVLLGMLVAGILLTPTVFKASAVVSSAIRDIIVGENRETPPKATSTPPAKPSVAIEHSESQSAADQGGQGPAFGFAGEGRASLEGSILETALDHSAADVFRPLTQPPGLTRNMPAEAAEAGWAGSSLELSVPGVVPDTPAATRADGPLSLGIPGGSGASGGLGTPAMGGAGGPNGPSGDPGPPVTNVAQEPVPEPESFLLLAAGATSTALSWFRRS
jgi:hypothetical protein